MIDAVVENGLEGSPKVCQTKERLIVDLLAIVVCMKGGVNSTRPSEVVVFRFSSCGIADGLSSSKQQ